jgi:RimJ/RimL family protein N-acetyltransferase
VTVLVDACRWPWRNRLWCHLVSDESFDEIHRFARLLGIPRVAFQGDHYDLDEAGRAAAIRRGATPVDSRELVRRLRAAGLRRGPEFQRRGLAGVVGLPAPELRTDRLILRQWRPADIEPMAKIDADPGVMRWVGDLRDGHASRRQIDDQAVLLGLRGFGKFAVEHAADGVFAGRVGVSPISSKMPFGPGLELGWRIIPALQGRGLATEAAAAVIRYCFDTLEVDRVTAFTVKANEPSISVMAKLGMVLVEEFHDPDLPLDHPRRPKLRFEIRSGYASETVVRN